MNLNKNQKFFEEATLMLIDAIFNHYATNNKIATNIKATRAKVLAQVAQILLKVNVTGETLELSAIERQQLFKEIDEVLTGALKEEIKLEQEEVKQMLRGAAHDSYYSKSFVSAFDVSYNIKPVSDEKLQSIVNTKIDGKLFSERIWANKNEVAQKVRREVVDFLSGKTNINKIADRIGKRFDSDYSASKRLAQNEICRVQTAANDEWATNHNIQWQLFTATLDAKTTHFCRVHDGKVYAIDDEAKPRPPETTHIGCRSCLINIIHKDWRPAERLDNITKERINYTTYKEWAAANGIEIKEPPAAPAAPAAAAPEAPAATKINNFADIKDFDQLEQYAKENLGIKTITEDVKKLDFEAIKGSVSKMELVFADFPQLKGYVEELNTGKGGIMSCGPTGAGFNGVEITFNPVYYKTLDKIVKTTEDSAASRFNPKGSYEFNMVHELGHAIEALLIKQRNVPFFDRTDLWNKSTISKEIGHEAVKEVKKNPEYKKKKLAELKQDISKYSLASWSETMAEAFFDWYANKENANILSKEIFKKVKEWVK